MLKKIILFFLVIFGAAATKYFAPGFVNTAYFIFLVGAYFYSKDEAFWLPVFLVISDGFLGFFGAYEATLSVIPGLPAVELGQFYIALTVVKASRRPSAYTPFYTGFLQILIVYIIFLIVQGITVGFPPGLNKKFSLLKDMLPLLLLYSIPRLFDEVQKYRDAFSYLFAITFSALFGQIFTITFGGITPSQFLGATEAKHLFFNVAEGATYRGIFSPFSVLIAMLGAMVFIALKTERKNVYLYTVIFSGFMTVFLSASRGWIISFSLMFFLFFLFVIKLQPKRVLTLSLLGFLIFWGAMSHPIVSLQIERSFERFKTVEAVAEGDLTAGGTLNRLTERGPRVMNKWEESKLTGFGFSEAFLEYGDFHTGNQTVLLRGGIFGMLLLYGFFAYFCFRMYARSVNLKQGNSAREALLVFCIFFMGWFIIHSSSGQQFDYAYNPVRGMLLAIFLSFGSLLYEKANDYNAPSTSAFQKFKKARAMKAV